MRNLSEASRCTSSDCSEGRCSCLRFAFPDTDASVGESNDGHTLSGSAVIEVRTGSELTARIDSLFFPGTHFRDNRFPSFVALPFPNRFDALNASTRLSYTATRYVPVYAEYVYYWYRFERPLGLAPGFPILVDRQGLRAGLAYSVPLVGRRRIQQ